MAGFYAALLFNSAPYFFIGAGVAALPEGPLTFSWLLCIWILMRLFFNLSSTGPMYRWLGLGIAFGLAFLSKYHAVFIPMGAGLFVMTDPAARKVVKGVGPVLALAAAVVVALPVIIWNYGHGWMSFSEFFHRGLTVRELHPGDAANNLAGQALLLMPWIWALLVWHLARGLMSRPRSSTTVFLSLMAVGPLVLFTAASAINGEWYQCHWPIVGYVSLFTLAGAALAGATGCVVARTKWFAVFCVTTMAGVAGCILLYATTPLSGPVSALIPGLAPAHSMVRNYDLSGYAGLDDDLLHQGVLMRTNLFVCAGNYMDCGRLAWSLRDRLPVLCVARWDEAKGFLFLPMASGWPGADALLVSRDFDVTSDLELAQPFFSRTKPAGSVTVGHGAHRTTLELHLLEGMSRPFPSFSAPVRSWEP